MTAVHLQVFVHSSVKEVNGTGARPNCQQRVDEVQRPHAYTYSYITLHQSHLTMHLTIGLTDYHRTISDGLMGYRTNELGFVVVVVNE